MKKRFLSIVLTLALVLSLMPGMTTTVVAAEHSDWPSTMSHTDCAHADAIHFYATENTYTFTNSTDGSNIVAMEGREFNPSESSTTDYDSDLTGEYMNPSWFPAGGWYYWDNSEAKWMPCGFHTWEYSLVGTDTIKAHCSVSGHTTANDVTLTITATDATYFRSLPEGAITVGDWSESVDDIATASDIYYVSEDGTTYEESTEKPTAAGNYYAKVYLLDNDNNRIKDSSENDIFAQVGFAISGNIALGASTENGYIFIKESDSEEYQILSSDGISADLSQIEIYAVPFYGYKLDKITVSYDGSSNDYSNGSAVVLPEDKEVTISASFSPITNLVELSDHAKMLLKKTAEFTEDTPEKAIETVAYYLADPMTPDYYCELFNEGEINEDDIRYVNTMFYMALLKVDFCLNGFATMQNAGFDELVTTINELPPVAYELLDLFDAVAAEDYANVLTLASQVGEDGLSLYNKVLGYEWGSEEALDKVDFLNVVKSYLTDPSVSGDLLNNTKKASEQYAAYIAERCGLTDPESLNKFKQYADDWAEDEGNRYMLNYYGSLLSEDEFSDLPENEKEDYINRTLTGICLSFFDSFLENHFAEVGEHYSWETSESSFVDIMRASLDTIVAHKESMINLIDARNAYYDEENWGDDEYLVDDKLTIDGAYHYIYAYLGELINALSSDQYDPATKVLYTDWDNLYLAMQGENVVTSAFEVKDTDTGREIKLLKDISCARLGIHGEALSVESEKSITLDLNGHKLDRNLKAVAENGSVITVESGASLTVQDSSTGKTGKITGGNTTGKGGGVLVNGSFTMTGGTITGNKAASLGGGIYNDGKVTLCKSVKISGNKQGETTASNLYLDTNAELKLNGLTTGAEIGIGVKAEDGVFVSSGATPELAGYFKGDGNKFVLLSNEKLLLSDVNITGSDDKLVGNQSAIDKALTLISAVEPNIAALKDSFNGTGTGDAGSASIVSVLGSKGYVDVKLIGVEFEKRAADTTSSTEITTFVFDVIPFDSNGDEQHTLSSEVTFRLPLLSTDYKYANVYHEGSFLKQMELASGDTYIELSAKDFSEYSYTLTNTKRTSGSSSAPVGHTVTSDLKNVTKVTIDGKVVDSRYYTVSGGNIILSGEFMKTLANGKHTVKLYDGAKVATGIMTVSGNVAVASAATGDMGVALYAALSVSSMLGMGWVGRKKRDEE